MLEKDLWKTMRTGIGNKWRAQRIEDSISSDIPDVFVSIGVNNKRISTMLELKCAKVGKKGGISNSLYTQGQRDFAMIHHTYLFLYVGGYYMLFDHKHCDEILLGQSIYWHLEKSIYYSNNPLWSDFIDIFSSHILESFKLS